MQGQALQPDLEVMRGDEEGERVQFTLPNSVNEGLDRRLEHLAKAGFADQDADALVVANGDVRRVIGRRVVILDLAGEPRGLLSCPHRTAARIESDELL